MAQWGFTMKKYSLVALFILVLITMLVMTYFFFLNIVFENKVANEELKSFQELKQKVEQPIILPINSQELKSRQESYATILNELAIQGSCRSEKDTLIIEGIIQDSASYLLLKQLLGIIKNDEATLLKSCVGQGCTNSAYGYKIEIRPYKLNKS